MSDTEGKTIHGSVGTIIETNHGQVRVNQHIASDIERYRTMSLDALRAEKERLCKKHNATRRAYLRHPTVLGFVLAIAAPIVFFLNMWGEKVTLMRLLSYFAGMFAVFATSLWMASRRRPLFDGLVLLKDELKIVEAFIAIHEAEAVYGK